MATTETNPRPGPRPSKSRQEIVHCALKMLDREGPEALTFRAVARELGMTVGALSRYFKSLADLEDEVAAQIMSELRPLQAKAQLRQELLRLSMDLLEINRTHPYLVTIHGPASAAVIASHTRQSLKVLTDAGFGFDRAMAIYSMLGSLPYSWALQMARHQDPAQSARIGQIFLEQLGEFGPQAEKMLGAGTHDAIFRRWMLIYIDALLAELPAISKRS